MGGSSSKDSQENYVLTVDEGWDSSTRSTPQSTPIMKNRKSLNKVSPGPNLNPKNEGGLSEKIRKGSKADLPPNLGNLGRASSMNSRGNGSRSIASMSRQMSFSGIGNGNNVGSGNVAAVAKSFTTAKACTWLVKNGNFNMLALASIEQERIIGTGLMGTVRVVHIQNKYFALKSIRKEYIHRRNDTRHVVNEREIMQQLNNPFCIKLFKTFQDTSNIYFAMELAVGGELFRRLNKKCAFPPQVAKFYLSEIFSAISHVQSLGYVYRDLKPENVMLDEEGHCKLVDFGFSTQPNEQGIVKTLCGTPAYLSPEQLDGKFTNGYSKIVDWWSLGILLFELMTGLTPFCQSNKESHYEIYLKILSNNISFPRGFDGPSKDLVKRLCHSDVPKRLCSAETIAEHEYFTMPWDAVHTRKIVPPFIPRIKDERDRDHYFNKYSEPRIKDDDTTSCHMDIEGF
jgi:tRNA A-37 threonylcarbamoyl transferase component Bud32